MTCLSYGGQGHVVCGCVCMCVRVYVCVVTGGTQEVCIFGGLSTRAL